jgi:hypothetical protein
MNNKVLRWQIPLLTVLIAALSGVLWRQFHLPSEPLPTAPPSETIVKATKDRPVASRFIPGVTFGVPAEERKPDPSNGGPGMDYLKINSQTCEQFTWDVPYLDNAAEIVRRYYKQIRSLGATITYTDPTPIPLPAPAPGQKKINLRIDGQDPYVEFLFKGKRYASFIRFLGGFNMLICSAGAINGR